MVALQSVKQLIWNNLTKYDCGTESETSWMPHGQRQIAHNVRESPPCLTQFLPFSSNRTDVCVGIINAEHHWTWPLYYINYGMRADSTSNTIKRADSTPSCAALNTKVLFLTLPGVTFFDGILLFDSQVDRLPRQAHSSGNVDLLVAMFSSIN